MEKTLQMGSAFDYRRHVLEDLRKDAAVMHITRLYHSNSPRRARSLGYRHCFLGFSGQDG